jgi:hypothetical protein
MGTYIPPNNNTGVDAFCVAWASCPANCISLVLGNLNINVEHPQDAREEQITNLLDEINLVDTSQNLPCSGAGCRRLRNDGRGKRSRWGDGTIPSLTTSWRGRGTYVTCGGLLLGCLCSMIRTTVRPLTPSTQDRHVGQQKYPQRRQRFPMRLPPRLHNGLTCNFEALKHTCKKPKPKR